MENKFVELLQKNKTTPYQVSKATGIAQSTLSDWKLGKSIPKYDKLEKIAQYFNVSVDYLLGKTDIKEKTPAYSDGDKDIADSLAHYMEALEKQDGLMFDGEPLDDESKELLLISLKNTMELARKMADKRMSDITDKK